MFFKILKSDFNNGIVAFWKKYITTFFMFLLFGFFFFLERGITARSNPGLIASDVNMGDYFFSLFAGSESGTASGISFTDGRIDFNLPTLWFFIILWLLIITLHYPYDELHGFGKHMVVLSKQRNYWWFSKCLWAVGCVILFYAIALLAVFLLTSCSGAGMSLNVSDYLPFVYINDGITVTRPPYSVAPNLLLVFAVSVALVLLQLVLSLKIGPKYSYGIMAGFIIISSFFDNILLLPNYAMAVRVESFLTKGLPVTAGLLLSLICICGSVLYGHQRFSNLDIMGGDN